MKCLFRVIIPLLVITFFLTPTVQALDEECCDALDGFYGMTCKSTDNEYRSTVCAYAEDLVLEICDVDSLNDIRPREYEACHQYTTDFKEDNCQPVIRVNGRFVPNPACIQIAPREGIKRKSSMQRTLEQIIENIGD